MLSTRSIESRFTFIAIDTGRIVLAIMTYINVFAFIENATVRMAITVACCQRRRRRKKIIFLDLYRAIRNSFTFTLKWLIFCVRFPFGFFKSKFAPTATNALGIMFTLISKFSRFGVEMTILLAISQDFKIIHCIEILIETIFSFLLL